MKYKYNIFSKYLLDINVIDEMTAHLCLWRDLRTTNSHAHSSHKHQLNEKTLFISTLELRGVTNARLFYTSMRQLSNGAISDQWDDRFASYFTVTSVRNFFFTLSCTLLTVIWPINATWIANVNEESDSGQKSFFSFSFITQRKFSTRSEKHAFTISKH